MDTIVFLLVCLFASSPWLTIAAVWMQLSLYTARMPEGWSLPSYLSATIEISNVAPLLYMALTRLFRLQSVNKAPFIFGMMCISATAMLGLSLFWETTVWVFGAQRSVVILAMQLCMSLVSTTSMVLYLPYMAHFHPDYTTAYFSGMCLSSFLPSVLKLVQGVADYDCVPSNETGRLVPVHKEPYFPVLASNLLVFGWLCLAVGAFTVLHLCYGRKRGATESKTQSTTDRKQHLNSIEMQRGIQLNAKGNQLMRRFRLGVLFTALALTSAQMNAIVPAILSFAALPYSLLTYHLSLTLPNVLQPLANFLPLWFRPRSLPVLLLLTAICTASAGYIFVLALQSPVPLLRDSPATALGSVLVTASAAVNLLLCVYLRVQLTAVMSHDLPPRERESALFWSGFSIQVGSFLGALVMFPLVNVFRVFQERAPCT